MSIYIRIHTFLNKYSYDYEEKKLYEYVLNMYVLIYMNISIKLESIMVSNFICDIFLFKLQAIVKWTRI